MDEPAAAGLLVRLVKSKNGTHWCYIFPSSSKLLNNKDDVVKNIYPYCKKYERYLDRHKICNGTEVAQTRNPDYCY